MNRVAKVLTGFLICGFACCLCLPSISKVRMSANRVTCLNNLKQIALALHNYHENFRSFPPGTTSNTALQPEDRLSWMVSILPYLEEDNLYLQINRDKAWNSPENQGINVEVKGLLCPESEFYGNFHIGFYVGMAGIGKDAPFLPPTDSKAGVFGYDRKTKLADVTDGKATTMMAIETNSENGPWAAGGFPTLRGADPDGPDYLGYTGQFGSRHRTEETFLFKVYPQCSCCVFVDGSAHILVKPMDSQVFEALCTIAGGEKVELPTDY
jgi:hypothetical protein